MYKNNIEISTSSICDLKEILENISNFSGSMPIKIRQEFSSKVSNLEKHPKMYPIIKIVKNREIRKIIIQKYVILYSIDNKQINILNMFPQKANYMNLIKV